MDSAIVIIKASLTLVCYRGEGVFPVKHPLHAVDGTPLLGK
ncbi:hypothetical protein C5167_004700 [Papaver somniferum]|uniref:Uncharacterized protein n=1 Tax=Papaver somniferum TaxID=3469 RepID=A0A4Y7JA77_PAPSO|nr:hypothetical protein C5167_004700 [Papaver somniferum]